MVSVRMFGASLLGLSLAACTSVLSQQDQAQAAHVLTQYHWERPAPTSGVYRHPLELQFMDGRVLANKLCNRVGASYEVKGTQLNIGQFMSTMMMCGDSSLMQWENYVSKHLPTVKDYAVSMASNSQSPTLTLNFKNGETWTLTGQATAETRYGGPAERVFLEVAPEKVSCDHPLMGKVMCMRVREITYSDAGLKTSTGEWRNFIDTIEGHNFVPGQRQILRLKRFTRKSVAADQSRYAYVLDMVVETEKVKR